MNILYEIMKAAGPFSGLLLSVVAVLVWFAIIMLVLFIFGPPDSK